MQLKEAGSGVVSKSLPMRGVVQEEAEESLQGTRPGVESKSLVKDTVSRNGSASEGGPWLGPVEDVKSTETESTKVTFSKGFVDSESEEDMEASSVTGRSTKGGSALPEEVLEASVNMSGASPLMVVGSMSQTSMSLVSNR